jgi:hypothetical protein
MAWNPRHGTVTLNDGTGGTPLDVDLSNEEGDFSVSGLIQGSRTLEALYDRGTFDQLIETQDVQITGSVSYRIDDWASSTDRPIDAALKLGNFASAVSTHATGDGVMLTIKYVVSRGGSTYTMTLSKCLCTVDQSESFPATAATINFTCYGGASFAKA